MKNNNKGTRWLMISSVATTMGMGVVLMMSSLMPSWGPVPDTRMVEGPIVGIHRQAGGPSVRISTKDDQVMDLAVDPSQTVVLLDGQVASTEELTRGQHVKAYYTTVQGKRTATSIVVRLPTVRFPTTEKRPDHAATPAK